MQRPVCVCVFVCVCLRAMFQPGRGEGQKEYLCMQDMRDGGLKGIIIAMPSDQAGTS